MNRLFLKLFSRWMILPNGKSRCLSTDKRIQPIKMSHNYYRPTNLITNNVSPLFIMHGLFGSKSNWNSLSKILVKLLNREVLSVDARNHGDSPHSEEFSYNHLAVDIKHLIEEMKIPKVCAIGHSMGGRAMMLFALEYKELVEKLIVVDITPINSSTQMTGMSKYFEAMKSVNIDNNLAMSEARKVANEQLEKSISDLSIRQFLITNLINKDGQYKWRINLNCLEDKFNTDVLNFPAVSTTFDKPTLFLAGLKSDYVRKEDEGKVRKIFPNAEFKYLNTGHWVHADNPEQFLFETISFINK